MPTPTVRRAFTALHLTLGLVILVESVLTLHHALGATGDHAHIGALAGVEAVAAALFLWPRTLRIGGVALLVVLALAIGVHALRGEFPAALLVYAAGVAFVSLHGRAPHPATDPIGTT